MSDNFAPSKDLGAAAIDHRLSLGPIHGLTLLALLKQDDQPVRISLPQTTPDAQQILVLPSIPGYPSVGCVLLNTVPGDIDDASLKRALAAIANNLPAELSADAMDQAIRDQYLISNVKLMLSIHKHHPNLDAARISVTGDAHNLHLKVEYFDQSSRYTVITLPVADDEFGRDGVQILRDHVWPVREAYIRTDDITNSAAAK